MLLKDRVAVVTGATRGIGRAIALALAAEGAHLVVVGTQAEKAVAVAAEIEQGGTRALGIGADISRADDVERLVESTKEHFGRIDILVNNAGVTRDGLMLRMKEDDWDTVIDVNLKGAFLCTRGVARLMTKQRSGRIINISSVVGQMGNPGQANYCAGKAGLHGLTRSNARELAKRQITVNAVAPGFIETDMTKFLTEQQRSELTTQIPLERLGHVDDIAATVVFLASDQAGYITGQVIGVNGGMYM
ncbi:3-oxoacyl-[acyl-carrier-protein] reductase [Pelovirga terrestris]|uniref:3-oxoacyl-[acyl-carrier-protein] reductase n=1 Tax=Pelovirga terrestris TaxID=2771352 RepID=A0A8J6UGE3_9BACT|nr:3-oxoacyl-[acyl-carrier-protein] reductase [Pelovirga terrestris]MBD1399598.1 3-oxoacyl-[acyl-carrier-protein] reductase [Pelovirga terrestris]